MASWNYPAYTVHNNGLPQVCPSGPHRMNRAHWPTKENRQTFSIFLIFTSLIFWTPHFWISRSPDLQVSGFPGPQISIFPDFQVPSFPDAADAGAAGAGRILRSQPDPSPNAPRDQIRRKGPCCDQDLVDGGLIDAQVMDELQRKSKRFVISFIG